MPANARALSHFVVTGTAGQDAAPFALAVPGEDRDDARSIALALLDARCCDYDSIRVRSVRRLDPAALRKLVGRKARSSSTR